MDNWLRYFAELTKAVISDVDEQFPGSGSAGGLGFALKYYLGGELESGAELILMQNGTAECIMRSDIVFTGEGCIDCQTTMGKGPAAVAELAFKYQKPCIALGGMIGMDADICNERGITAYFPIIQRPMTIDEAMDKAVAADNLRKTAEQVIRLVKSI